MKSILVSSHIESTHGSDIRTLLDDTFQLVGFRPGKTDMSIVEGAFLSADIMDKGANAAVNPPLAAFLDAVSTSPSLRWLHICSAGADRAVLREMMKRGVILTTSSGANARSVANAAIAGMMALERNVAQWVLARQARHWTPRNEVAVPAELAGSRATILGMGPIGQDIARVCKALDMHVTGVRRSSDAAPGFDEVLPFKRFDAVLPRTDWLFIACPLTDETRGLMSAERLAKLPRHGHLINIARGPIVVESALDDALRKGTLAGAYSDVFAAEPLQAESPLWDAPNFLMSPHTAGRSSGFAPRTLQMFKDNLSRWVNDETLLHRAM